MHKYFYSWVCCFVCLFSLIIPKNAFASFSDRLESIKEGQVIAEYEPVTCETRSAILINAPIEKIWTILEDQEKMAKVIDKIKKIEVLEQKDDYQKIKASVKLAFFLPAFHYTLLYDQSEKYRRIKFSKIEGNLKALDGSIEIKPKNNNTLLIYKMRAQTYISIPSFIQQKSLKNDIPRMMRSFKKEAES